MTIPSEPIIQKFIMKNKKPITLSSFYLVALIIFMLMPAYSFGGQALQESINTYYDAEKKGDWAKVYSLRTKAFKKSVNKNIFVSEMKEAAKGWELLKYEVEDISMNGDSADVRISFLENPPADYWAGSGMKASNISSKTYSVWVKEGKGWRCKESPSRSYLPFRN